MSHLRLLGLIVTSAKIPKGSHTAEFINNNKKTGKWKFSWCKFGFKYLSINCLLGNHDLFGTKLAMIFSFRVGPTDSVMQQMQLFFLSVSVRHFIATALTDLLF
jgi:hypothetical protein